MLCFAFLFFLNPTFIPTICCYYFIQFDEQVPGEFFRAGIQALEESIYIWWFVWFDSFSCTMQYTAVAGAVEGLLDSGFIDRP